MIEPAEIDTKNNGRDESEYAAEGELPTNRLTSSHLDNSLHTTQHAGVGGKDDLATVDWLAKLTTRQISSEDVVEADTPVEPAKDEPSGMGQHASPPRMVPTRGARFTIGLRRTVLMAALALFAVGVLAATAYGLASTSWLSSLFTTQGASVAPASQQEITVSAPQPIQAEAGAEPQAQTEPQPQVEGVAPTVVEAPTTSTSSASELRDRGIASYKAGNFAQAIELLESAVLADETDSFAYYQLGLAYMAATGQERALDDAELAFRTAQSLQPDWAAPYGGLAETLIRREFYEEAVAPALEAIRLDPNMAEAWLMLGRAYQGAGQELEATQAFIEAARHAPAPPMQP